MDDGRVTRRSLPTQAITMPQQMVVWIAEQAQKRNTSKSEIVREAISEQMKRVEAEPATA
jgi:Arc/MetJ-type ribon-helix-helix transcriptional regulator